MPIRAFLSGEVFEPEILSVMSEAFTAACNHLGLHIDADDAMTRLVAAKVIEFARRGVHETEKLIALTIEEFTSWPQAGRTRNPSTGLKWPPT